MSSNPGKSATINDVAELAGVSVTTVSRIINNEPGVRQKTRDKVEEAIRQLDYRPNINARGLAGDRSFLVGLFIENAGSYANDIQAGMVDRCLASGLHLMVEPLSGTDAHAAEKVGDILRQLRLEAAVLLPPHCDNPAILAQLEQENVPFVQISPTHQHPRAPAIRVDDYAAARRMTDYLLSVGHRRIGFMMGERGHRATQERHQGFLDAMAAQQVPVIEGLVACGRFTFDGGLAAAQTMLDHDPAPTAILTSGDDMAVATIYVAQERGLKLPEDLSITGFDDSPIASMVWPRLTTIRQPVVDIGAAAIRLITDHAPRRHGWPENPPEIVLDFKLIIRKSTTARAIVPG